MYNTHEMRLVATVYYENSYGDTYNNNNMTQYMYYNKRHIFVTKICYGRVFKRKI